MTLPTNSIIFRAGTVPDEVIRIDAQGFHYRGQFIDMPVKRIACWWSSSVNTSQRLTGSTPSSQIP